jgi:class 3 adenylate cyclase
MARTETVTVLFTDLVGSTELRTRLGEERGAVSSRFRERGGR